MSDKPIVHIVDDDPAIRKSLKMVMEAASLAVCVHESAEEFLEQVDPGKPGCLVVDVRMPGVSGIELLQRLRESQNEIPAIIITGHADVPTAVKGMKLGALDFLQKPFEPAVLLNLVRDAIQKSISLNETRSERERTRRRLEKLTPRELELLKLVVAGMPSKQIASELKISVRTVTNHRANLMRKTMAANAAELAHITAMAGI